MHEWARDDEGMANARYTVIPAKGPLQPSAPLRVPSEVPIPHLYVATYEAMVHTKRVTPTLIQRVCLRVLLANTGYT
jgi:hypothetical protein